MKNIYPFHCTVQLILHFVFIYHLQTSKGHNLQCTSGMWNPNGAEMDSVMWWDIDIYDSYTPTLWSVSFSFLRYCGFMCDFKHDLFFVTFLFCLKLYRLRIALKAVITRSIQQNLDQSIGLIFCLLKIIYC